MIYDLKVMPARHINPPWLVLVIIVFFVALLFYPKNVYAADFLQDYDVYYTVAETGTTYVKQNVTLTNQVTDFYAHNFTLSIFSQNISQVKAHDPGGDITSQVVQSGGQTLITVPFNVKVAGKDKQFTFTLEYQTTDIAQKKGLVWEIIIPGIDKTAETRSYKVHLSVPANFGFAAYFSPLPNSGNTWDLAESDIGGITAAYGTTQQYSFNLIYHLTNDTHKPYLQEITLPPETAFQSVILNRLSEQPQKVTRDSDGNWLAQYRVEANSTKKILAEGLIVVGLNPQGKNALSETEKAVYTQSQPFWDSTPEMQTKAKELGTVEAIYKYVVTTLNYDYERVQTGIERLGASHVYLNHNSAACMEFSDLFVALARAAGIPAREVHGYAYTNNPRLQPLSLVSDVLHAWVEYYDAKRGVWVPIDPTWEKTTHGVDYFHKLDFNHIAFAILGHESDYPYPAGSFKGETQGKDVFVDFVTAPVTIPAPKFTYSLDVPLHLLSGFATTAKLRITNSGSVLYKPQQLSFNSNQVVYSKTDLKPIPPYGEIEVPLKVTQSFNLWPQRVRLTATLDAQVVSKEVLFLPFYQYYLAYGVWGFLGLAAFGILLVYARHRWRQNS